MTYKVVFDTAAELDLQEIADWIVAAAGPATAVAYVTRLRTYCGRLDFFPKRGTPREDLFPGLRTIGFERRALIAYLVRDDTVSIVRILYGGQDADAALRRLE